MTVSLCIRQESERNDDSVSVEELDWSAERQVLITAEHKNSSPNTDDLYIHYMDKSTGTPPSLEEKKALPNCDNKDGNIIHVLRKLISTSVEQFWSVWNDCTHMYKSLVFGDEFFGSRSAFKVTPEVFSCLSADQSSSSTLTESSFLFDPCLIHRDTVMLE